MCRCSLDRSGMTCVACPLCVSSNLAFSPVKTSRDSSCKSGYRDRTLPYHSTCYQDGIKSLDGSSAGLYTGQRGYRGTYTSQTAPCISNDTNRDTNLNTNHNTNQIVVSMPVPFESPFSISCCCEAIWKQPEKPPEDCWSI